MTITTSSPNRVIKQGDSSSTVKVNQFIPPETRNIKLKPVKKTESSEADKTEEAPYSAGKGKGRRSSKTHYLTPEEVELQTAMSIVEAARKEAQQLLVKAGERVERILEEAETEGGRIKEEARKEGYQEGFLAGCEEGRRQVREEYLQEVSGRLALFQKEMETGLSALETAKEKCLGNYLDELKDIAVSIAEKVIHVSLGASGEVMKRMIVSATEKLKKTTWVKIYIDKYDYEMMMEADTDIIDELTHLSDNIKFIVMDKEDKGNCIIEMPDEIVDLSVNTQLENIKDILENVHL